MFDESCVTTGVCPHCEELKTWNHWYHHDPALCDDCYFSSGKYYKMTKEEIEVQKIITQESQKNKLSSEFIVGTNDVLFLDKYVIGSIITYIGKGRGNFYSMQFTHPILNTVSDLNMIISHKGNVREFLGEKVVRLNETDDYIIFYLPVGTSFRTPTIPNIG
jgi:hypothetical protein